MGHTVWSQRIVLDKILKELEKYGKSMRQEDAEIYQKLLKQPLKHISNISYASSIHVWAFVLLSIILEQEKKIKEFEKQYESLVNRYVQEQELYCIMDKGKTKYQA
ncbi:MAG: hypothetical protein MAG795_00803 [Candidatus Woesearchaeota archaeon]|nr:hypothetical protein [Candidatus Woesearchaeota archaeon]